MNNEAKVYRSIKSIILEKAKIISYKNIKKIRTKRIAKKIINDKKKYDRKRKSIALETSKLKLKSKLKSKLKLELKLDVTRIIEASKL